MKRPLLALTLLLGWLLVSTAWAASDEPRHRRPGPGRTRLALPNGPKTVLLVAGTPEQMGAAHWPAPAFQSTPSHQRVLYMVGGIDSIHSPPGSSTAWQKSIAARFHTSPRFSPSVTPWPKRPACRNRKRRLPTLSRAIPLQRRGGAAGDGRWASAPRPGARLHARHQSPRRGPGRRLHAGGLQHLDELGYGFVGNVTAMNERGLAVGEMERGEGNWDGMPMSLLLRDVMERASTVDERSRSFARRPGRASIYVLSDKSRAMVAVHATPSSCSYCNRESNIPCSPGARRNRAISGPDAPRCSASSPAALRQARRADDDRNYQAAGVDGLEPMMRSSPQKP